MVRIVFVGCSFTEGFGDYSDEETYPYIIKEQRPDWEIFNLGLRGSNNYFGNLVMEEAIKVLRPNLVVRQLTHCNRWMDYENTHYFRLLLKETETPGYTKLDHYEYIKDYAMWTISGISHPYPKILSKHEIAYRNKLKDDFYNVMSDGLAYELDDCSFYKTEALLANTPHFMFFWRDNGRAYPSWQRWQKYFCVERDFGFDHVVDEGRHFLREGNQKLVEEVLMPEILKNVQL